MYLRFVKKLLLSLITFIYLMMSSGVAMEVHYCMGKKAGVDLYKTSESKCGKCGMKEKKGGCCRDEHKFYKLSTDHKNVSADLSLKVPVAAAEQVFFHYQYFLPVALAPVPQAHAPPGIPSGDICILHCVFRI